MKSGGFSLGKKKAVSDVPKRTTPPNSTDLTQLLATSQKNPGKPFQISWQSPTNKDLQWTLTVMIGAPPRDHRAGWSSSAMDSNALGEAEWKLYQDLEGRRTELFAMQSSDTFLAATMMEEALGSAGSLSAPVAAAPVEQPYTGGANVFEDQSSMALHATLESPPSTLDASAQRKSALPQEGNLRQTGVRSLLELYNTSRATGRVIFDTGTVTAEVFFMEGEPVHAKSCHSFYQDKDTVGDAVIIDVLTWKDGTFKFQQDWPAASKSINSPLHMFLNGEITAPPPAHLAPPPVAAPPPPVAAAPRPAAPPPPPPAPPPPAQMHAAPPAAAPAGGSDFGDFSVVDDLIAETYSNLIDGSGMLTIGMFLMLARCEFVRFESGRLPFCVATIGLEVPGRKISQDALRKIGECFEPVCQPLDIMAAASPSRLFALFPQCTGATALSTLKYFSNGVASIPLDDEIHGSHVRITIGLAEIPRDGDDFQKIFEHAAHFRSLATADRRIVNSAG